MRVALLFVMFVLFALSAVAGEGTIRGTVKVAKSASSRIQSGGSLFVFARPVGQSGGPPSAVVKIDSPKFPQAFELGPENAMIAGTPFTGPFQLTARFSPTGDALQKAGAVEGATKGKVKPGSQGIAITLDTLK